MSFTGTTSVPGVGSVANEDIVTYDTGTDTWALLFDGSDVGLSALTIDGFAVTSGGDFLISFAEAASVAGMTGGPSGTTLDDSDIVRFIPTSTGATTAGSFVFHFDGSDVGLTQNGEDIDAISLTSDGRLIISLLSSGAVNGVSNVQDEDLLVFNSTSLGSVTTGSFSLYFDGSDVGLSTSSSENIDAVAIAPDGSILFSTVGNFAVTGLSGPDEDVAQFVPTSLGGTTAGTFAALLDLSSLGIATSADVNAVERITAGPRMATKPQEPPLGGRCVADFDCDSVAGVPDLFAFISEFLAREKVADVDESGVVDTRDLMTFLSAYFAGCEEL